MCFSFKNLKWRQLFFFLVIRNKEQFASVYLHDIFIIQRYWNNLTL